MVLDNIKNSAKHLYERFSSPFGGTFITVWVIHHWQLVYSFFTFDDDCTLNDRIYILQRYLDKSNTNELLWAPLAYTFIVMFAYLLLSNLGYAILLLFNKWAKPFIHFVIDRNKNASREDLDRIKGQLFDAYDQLEKTKDDAKFALEEKNKIEAEFKKVKTNVANLRAIQTDQTIKVADLEKKLKEVNEKYEFELTKNVNEQYQIMASKIHAEEILIANKIFNGAWKLNYKKADGESGTDLFYIDSENKYLISESVAFVVINMFSIENGKYVNFTKHRDGNPEINLVNRLVKIGDGHYIGVEDEDIYVEYTKINKGKIELRNYLPVLKP